jgi:hypothetical protein
MSPEQRHTAGWRQQWLALPLLCLLPLLAGAQGTIVHVQLSTPNPDPNFPWDAQGLRLWTEFTTSSYALDVNGDGNSEFTLSSGPASYGGFAISAVAGNSVLSLRSLDTTFVVPLDSLSPIGADPVPFDWTRHGSPSQGLTPWSVFTASVNIGSIGLFTGVESAYTGLQFQLGGRTHYGWVRVGAPIAGANGGWIYDYAYETRPDTPILAGAVPEPSTWVLLVTGGFLFWFCGRKKRMA